MSGLYWHERVTDCLHDMHFTACNAETNIWIRAHHNVYDYIAVYVDDLVFAMKDQKKFAKELEFI